MNQITFLKVFFSTVVKRRSWPHPPALGRWAIDYESVILNRKIDLANSDNCGCSGSEKTEIKSNDENLSR